MLDQLTAARDRALSGQSGMLVVDGDAGLGKSTLLDDLIAACADFRILTAKMVESAIATPYGLLAQWIESDVVEVPDPQLAAQQLRNALDDRPTLLIADDVQWADPESLAALIDVIDRLDGDRVLVAIATTTLAPRTPTDWREWCEHSGRVVRLHLEGLDLETATEVLRERQPALEPATIRALWEHTGGNPLYLVALASEYQPDTLARAYTLPAPKKYADVVRSVLDRMAAEAVLTVRAIAVLGGRWSALPDVTELTELPDVAEAMQQLVDAQLVELRPASPAPAVRIAQTLTRAAIYQDIPLPLRRTLHERAATIASGQAAVFDHRLAAAARYDDQLADDVDAYAQRLYEQRSYRLASHYIAAASNITRNPELRERRFLESVFDTLVAGDRLPAQAELAAITEAADPARRALVLGMLAIWERRYADGIAMLEAGETADGIDPLTGYRLDVLLAWGRLMVGAPAETIRAALRGAAERDRSDSSIRRLAMLCENQLAARQVSDADPFAPVADLPEHPSKVPIAATAALAWRGVLRTNIGQFADGIADLEELIKRIQAGVAEYSSGTFHASLARAQWFTGNWSMARLNMRLARDLASTYAHPIVAAIAPLIAIGDGDLVTADAALHAAHRQIDAAPWVEAVDLLNVADVQREHAAGTGSAAIYRALRRDIAAIRAGELRKSVLWNLHASLATIWAGQFDDARTCIDAVQAAAVRIPWATAAADWVKALAAEAAGDGRAALRAIRDAVSAAPVDVPLYAAHMHADHARLAHVLGDAAAANRSLDVAAATYRRLGAGSYVARIEALQRTLTAVPEKRIGVELSERERDVLTLVTSGMSYAQISNTLFITQSTVSFHLGRIYAKANVKSRHQLTELIRTDPAVFGLS